MRATTLRHENGRKPGRETRAFSLVLVGQAGFLGCARAVLFLMCLVAASVSAHADQIVIDGESLTITGDDSDPGSIKGQSFMASIADGVAEFVVAGELVFDFDDTVTVVGGNGVSLVAGGNVAIQSGALFDVSASGQTPGAGGGLGNGGNVGPQSGGSAGGRANGGIGGPGGPGGGIFEGVGLPGVPGLNGFPGSAGSAGSSGFLGGPGSGGVNNPSGGGAGGAGGSPGSAGARGIPGGLFGVGGCGGSSSVACENGTGWGGPGQNGGTGAPGQLGGIGGGGSAGFGGTNSMTAAILSGGGGGGAGGSGGSGGGGGSGSGGGGGGGGGGSQGTAGTTGFTGGFGGSGGKSGPGSSGGSGGISGNGGGGGGALEVYSLGRIQADGDFFARGGNGANGGQGGPASSRADEEDGAFGLERFPGGRGGNGGRGGEGAFGGAGGTGGPGAGGAGGTIMLTASQLDSMDASVDATGGGGGRSGGDGRLVVSQNSFVAYEGGLSGAALQTFAGPRAPNMLISDESETPYIPDLIGGSERFGVLDGVTVRDLSFLVARAPARATVALSRPSTSNRPAGYDDDYAGFELLLFLNLCSTRAKAPRLGVGQEGFSVPLLTGGIARNPDFTPAAGGPVTLAALEAEQVYATLIPQVLFDMAFGVQSKGGGALPVEDVTVRPGETVYLVDPAAPAVCLPEPSTALLELVAAGSLALLARRRVRGESGAA